MQDRFAVKVVLKRYSPLIGTSKRSPVKVRCNTNGNTAGEMYIGSNMGDRSTGEIRYLRFKPSFVLNPTASKFKF